MCCSNVNTLKLLPFYTDRLRTIIDDTSTHLPIAISICKVGLTLFSLDPAVHSPSHSLPVPCGPSELIRHCLCYKQDRKNVHILDSSCISNSQFKELWCQWHDISMGWWKKDITPLPTHWSYVFLAQTHWYQVIIKANPHIHIPMRILHNSLTHWPLGEVVVILN